MQYILYACTSACTRKEKAKHRWDIIWNFQVQTIHLEQNVWSLEAERDAACQTGIKMEIAFYVVVVLYAAHETPLLAPLETLTAAH